MITNDWPEELPMQCVRPDRSELKPKSALLLVATRR